MSAKQLRFDLEVLRTLTLQHEAICWLQLELAKHYPELAVGAGDKCKSMLESLSSAQRALEDLIREHEQRLRA